MPARSTATYVYCIVRAPRKPAAGRLPPGVPGAARPRLIAAYRGVWIAAADVPLSIYDTAALEPRLADLAWVSEAAVAHEAVVEHFARMRRITVVPMTLFTMFADEEKAANRIRESRAAIDAAIRRIAGCDEWGIRIFADASPAAPRPARTRAAAAVTGTAFLETRKALRDAGRQARVDSIEAAERAFDALQPLARDARRRQRSAEPGANPPLVEAAFLVPASRASRFKSAARRQAAACAAAGARMILTGPWPAYNFVGSNA